MSQRFRLNKSFKQMCDVTYIIYVVGLGLASQEVDVLAKSTNKNSWNLYGYDKMTQPQLSIQHKSKIGKTSLALGLFLDARVRR